MSHTTITYLVGAGCGMITLITFGLLVVAPAVSSYRTPLQRTAAVLLSVYVLAAFVGVGILLGALIILEWPRVF